MAIKPKKKTSSPKLKTKNKFLKNILIIIAVLLMIALVLFGYFLGRTNDTTSVAKNTALNDSSKIKNKKPIDSDKLKDEVDNKHIVKPKNTDIINKHAMKTIININKIKKVDNFETHTIKTEPIILADKGKKPKLVIVIDDVHTIHQLRMIQKLKMKITPSIFPPYSLAKNSHLLSQNLKHFMIHLPMESDNKQFNKQSKTLMSSFSDEKIVGRVMEIRKLFPTGRYVNNHTGSVFTSNYDAMKKLYIALKLEGFVFVDSFTKASSKVEQVADEYGDAYVRRNSFIDNVHTVKYIHNQLKSAVKKAKKSGYAIAIGHPHNVTMKALKYAKTILKEVDLVYIDELYKRK